MATRIHWMDSSSTARRRLATTDDDADADAGRDGVRLRRDDDDGDGDARGVDASRRAGAWGDRRARDERER